MRWSDDGSPCKMMLCIIGFATISQGKCNGYTMVILIRKRSTSAVGLAGQACLRHNVQCSKLSPISVYKRLITD